MNNAHRLRSALEHDWMAWIALRHFLPAAMLRDVLDVATREVTEQRLGVADLFYEQLDGAALWSETWLLSPRDVRGRTEHHLQEVIRLMAWQNDEVGMLPDEHTEPRVRLLDAVARLGAADFGWPGTVFDDFDEFSEIMQPGFASVLAALKAARTDHRATEVAGFWSSLAPLLQRTAGALEAVATKHLADLCADVDSWDKALFGYQRTNELLRQCSEEAEWRDVVHVWRGLVKQSEAAALAVLEGPKAASDLLTDLVEATSFPGDSVLRANSGADSMTLLQEASEDGWSHGDTRVAIMRPPLLHASHEPRVAITHWLNGKHRNANRWFWATLRRQTALGTVTGSRSTKAFYGRALVDELSAEPSVTPETFALAVRMLIESGQYESASRCRWNNKLVDTYVTPAAVEQAIAQAAAFAGARLRRELVVIELFRSWVAHLAPSGNEAAIAMLKHLAGLAGDFRAALASDRDVGRRSADALTELADARPELRVAVAAEVASAVASKLTSEDGWHDKEAALKLGSAYADGFEASVSHGLARATLDLLGKLDPAAELWPLVRPALELLVEEPMKAVYLTDADLERQALSQILRFGTGQESEHSRLFYYLRNLRPTLLKDPDIRAQLDVPLAHVRRRAKEINSSNVVEHICALLLAPAAAGAEGLKDALEGLLAILVSANGVRRSIAFSYAYESVLLLVDERDAIEGVLGTARLAKISGKLRQALVELWHAATDMPLLFAPFSFPLATKPNSVTIHNWAFASMRFGQVYGGDGEISRALKDASSNAQLGAAIALATETRGLLVGPDAEVVTRALTDDREAFYSALGRRLVQLHRMSDEAAKEFCAVLAQQCLRFGPRAIDASVLLAAAKLGLGDAARSWGLTDYARRLEGEEDLRLTLGPILSLFRQGRTK